nr:MAG TPA: hypothetical protein [Bacteriophage sp.]
MNLIDYKMRKFLNYQLCFLIRLYKLPQMHLQL